MKQLYFIRHGQSQANVDRVYAGQADTPLTTLGRRQALAAVDEAKRLHIDHIVSSPLSRTYDTAVIVADGIGFPEADIELNSSLMERNYGTLVGKPWDFTVNIDGVAGVESLQSIFERGRQAYAYLAALPYDNVLVVSHGTFYQALKTAIEPDYSLVEGREPDNAEIVRLV